MSELIAIKKQTITGKEVNAVDARELHKFLEVKSEFRNWIKNRIKDYGFQLNQDFISVGKNLPNGGRSIEYFITLDMAKELSMVERNEKGKDARKYFIECERKLKDLDNTSQTINRIMNDPDFGIQLLQTLKEERQKRLEAEHMNKILTHHKKVYTTTEIAKEIGFKSAIALNNALYEEKIQFKSNGTWVLYSKYSDMGYINIKQEVLDSGKVIYHRKWTQEGRKFLIDLFNEKETKWLI